MSIKTNTTSLQDLLERVNALPDAGGEQATPVISVATNGLIIATAGAKSSTYQLAFQPAKTITPSTASQIAVSSGYYTGGNITVAGDSNLVAENIKSGVSIFGVNGTLKEGGGSGSDDKLRGFIERTITEVSDDEVETIGFCAFYDCHSLTTASFPAAITVSGSAFNGCTNLTTASFPAVMLIGNEAFARCTNLTTVSFPAVTTIDYRAFHFCSNLTTASFPAVTTIESATFAHCSNLTTVSFPAVTTISNYAFEYCTNLTTVSFPAVRTISDYAFAYCSSLTTANFPAVTTISDYAFGNCTNLTTVSFPVVTTIGSYAFAYCSSLTTANFPAKIIYNYAFRNCSNLTTLKLFGNKVCSLYNRNAFTGTPYSSASYDGTPVIYVPSVLLSSYQTATNWTYYSSYFVGVDIELPPEEKIEFFINDVSYEAEDGMTWSDWVNSDYNVDGYMDDGYWILTSEYTYIYDSNWAMIESSMMIIESERYQT